MKLLKHTLLITVCTLLLQTSSCKQETEKQVASYDGVYQSVGYGRIVKIAKGEYHLADITRISCLPLMEGKITELGEALQLKNDTLSLQDGINKYLFTRIENSPATCTEDLSKEKKNDPEYNFEVLWETFKDHYAYFDLRKVDPEKMYAEYRPKVTSETTQPELFFILSEMLDSFEDGHIGISASEEIEEAAQKFQKGSQNAESIEPKKRLRGFQVSKMVADKYIPNGTSIKNGNLRWDIIEDNVGYLQMNQMMCLANYNLSDTLSYGEYWRAFVDIADSSKNDTQDELDGLKSSLDVIMKDFENTDALIIDVRFNGGGKDEVGMALLERLNDTEKLAFTKKGKFENGFTPVNKVVQTASKNSYNKPVYLLISPESASATEIMALSSLSMPNITLIGSSTEGVFSDVLDRFLPNGWEFGLSSEVYLDLDGNNYEGIGIPPDVEIDYSRDTQEFLAKVLNDLEKDSDPSIEMALEMRKSK